MHLLTLLEKLPHVFTIADVARVTSRGKETANKLCRRYAEQKIILRLKRDLYIFTSNFLHLDRLGILELSGKIHTSSYVSFGSALTFYRVFIGYKDTVEAVSTKRSSQRQIGHITFQYHRLPKKYFFSYVRQGDMKIATPEKALLDLLYLYSLGRYDAPFRRINLEALNMEKLIELSYKFPPRTRKILNHFIKHGIKHS